MKNFFYGDEEGEGESVAMQENTFCDSQTGGARRDKNYYQIISRCRKRLKDGKQKVVDEYKLITDKHFITTLELVINYSRS